MLSGVLHPTEGSVECLGVTPWEDRTSYVRRIAAVFGQKTQLMWDLPPSDTFALNQRLYRVPKDVYERNVEYFADSFDLGAVLGTPVRNLSLGERMKCELTAAMLHDPELVFLDEPTIGLDLIAKDIVRSFVKTVNRDRNVTFLLTTHDLDDVEDLCQRVTIINHGRIVHDSTMEELKRSYATRKVADIRLNRPVDAAQLAGWEVLELTDQTCRIVVDADGPNPVSALGELLATLPVKDLEVASPPIEAVIRRIYGTGVDAGIDAET
jgi:ABC-2 type transport system ATP-binding protein